MSGVGDLLPHYLAGRERVEACVNALAGIADPAAQVERWKAMEVLLQQYEAGRDPELLLSCLSPEEIAALAAEWTPDD